MKKNLSAHLCFSLILLLFFPHFLGARTDDRPQNEKIHHEVVVTATRLETPLKETASAISVLNLESLFPLKSIAPENLFSLVPGVFYAQAGPAGGAGSLYLRGGNSEHTLFMIDGVEINDPAAPSRSFNFNLFNLGLVDRLEILRGPQSTLYGSDALAGVVNFVSSEPDRNHSEFYLSAGTQKTWQGAFSLSRRGRNFSYELGLNSWTTAGVSAASKYYPGNKEADGFSQQALAFKIKYELSPDFSLTWQTRGLLSEADLDAFGGPYGDDPNFKQKSAFLFERLEANFFLFQHRWEQKLIFGVEVNQRKNHNDPDEWHPGESERASYRGTFYKLDWQNNLFLTASQTVIFGLEFKEEAARSEDHYSSPFGSYESFFPRKQTGLLGFYFQDQWKPAKGLSFTSGFRLDQHQEFGTALTYRLAANFAPAGTGWKIRATLGSGFKAPSLYQLYAPASSFGPIGNSLLKPEKNTGWDAGVERDWSQHFSTALTYFENRYRNLIQFYFGTGYLNLGRALTRGLEASLRFRPFATFYGEAGWTWLQALDLDNNEALIRRPAHSGFAHLVYSRKKLRLGLELNYVGERTDFNYSSYPVEKVTLPAYLLTNLNFKYDLSEKLEAFLLINNLFNVRYELIYGYGTPGTTISTGFRLKLF
jgi:vitamin B12 transporter